MAWQVNGILSARGRYGVFLVISATTERGYKGVRKQR